MNFKKSKAKIIWSLVIGLAVNLAYNIYTVGTAPCEGGLCRFRISQEILIEQIFSLNGLLILIFGAIIFYIIWSLIQKK